MHAEGLSAVQLRWLCHYLVCISDVEKQDKSRLFVLVQKKKASLCTIRLKVTLERENPSEDRYILKLKSETD